MSEIEQWLDAEREYQVPKIMGGIADSMLAQEVPLVVPGPALKEMAERQFATGMRWGSSWVSLDGASVVPQWVSKGLEQQGAEVPEVVSVGAIPEEGVAQVVSWKDLRL